MINPMGKDRTKDADQLHDPYCVGALLKLLRFTYKK